MRHRKTGIKLNRTTSHRQAMFRNMVTSLLKHESIQTTDVKAKELRRWADHLITLAKRGDLHARRQAMAIVREKDVVHKLFEEAGKRFGDRNGGYTRIVKIGHRPGDAAPISLIELLAVEVTEKKGKKKAKDAPKKKAKAVEQAVMKKEGPAPESEDQPSQEQAADAPAEAKESQTAAASGKPGEDLQAAADNNVEDQPATNKPEAPVQAEKKPD